MKTTALPQGADNYRSRPTFLRKLATLIGAVAIATFVAIAPLGAAESASAATPFAQCNGVDNTPGLGITCNVTITNTFDAATGVGSSVTVLTECHGAANTAPSSCVTSTRSGNTVISSVSQCNGSINGGGGTVICNVRVTNNITGASTVSGATVNECVGSGGGGGTEPTLACNPGGSSSGAVVTQCNGSANGGGGSMRVRCSVLGSTTASALRVTVDQCNGSANGGGSTVTCTAAVTNNVTAGSSSLGSTGGSASGSTGGNASSSAGGSTGGSAAVTPGAVVVTPTAAQLAQIASDARSAAAVQASLAGIQGAPIPALGTGDTASASAERAAQEAIAAALAESLAHAGYDASGFIGASVVAGLIGFGLFFLGRRNARSPRVPKEV
jgi:hypothetical protein